MLCLVMRCAVNSSWLMKECVYRGKIGSLVRLSWIGISDLMRQGWLVISKGIKQNLIVISGSVKRRLIVLGGQLKQLEGIIVI